MAVLDSISASIAALAAKVDAHILADTTATAALTDANKKLQDEVAALTAQLAASTVTPEQAAALAGQIDAIGAKLP